MPFLSRISLPPLQDGSYLQHIPSLGNGLQLKLKDNVTFFVGENGSGKSTLLEGVAEQCGFSLRGGNRNHNFNTGHRFEGYGIGIGSALAVGVDTAQDHRGVFHEGGKFF